jgi:DNA-binding transcriptional MerR regulator
VATLLTIGEFSRLTHVSVKALRHYDDVGLLRPADVDAATGYRRYAAAQVPVAHVIRRFRDLDMPLGQIRAVLDAPDIDARDRAIVAHLERMERVLEQTRETVASLRTLLDGGEPDLAVEYRSVPATPALAIGGRVAWGDAEAWLADALGELGRAVGPDSGRRAGPDGALYGPEFFEQHVGEVVAFVPLAATADAPGSGRAERVDIPARRPRRDPCTADRSRTSTRPTEPSAPTSPSACSAPTDRSASTTWTATRTRRPRSAGPCSTGGKQSRRIRETPDRFLRNHQPEHPDPGGCSKRGWPCRSPRAMWTHPPACETATTRSAGSPRSWRSRCPPRTRRSRRCPT